MKVTIFPLILLIFFSCTSNRYKEIDAKFCAFLESGEGELLDKADISYPLNKSKVTLKSGNASCSIDTSALNSEVREQGPVVIPITLNVSKRSLRGLSELTPGSGNGVAQLLFQNYNCYVTWKRRDCKSH